MKQATNSSNRYDSLSPEKIYFVEKFGYLIKKINGGYGAPVQNALYERINGALDGFKLDLPNIVRELEIIRLKTIEIRKASNQQNKSTSVEKSEQKVSVETVEIAKQIRNKIESTERKVLPAKSVIEIEIDTAGIDSFESDQYKNIESRSSSILQKSAAMVAEERRAESMRVIKKEEVDSAQKLVQQKVVKSTPIKTAAEMTDWEKKWHKYDNDIMDDDLKGYT